MPDATTERANRQLTSSVKTIVEDVQTAGLAIWKDCELQDGWGPKEVSLGSEVEPQRMESYKQALLSSSPRSDIRAEDAFVGARKLGG